MEKTIKDDNAIKIKERELELITRNPELINQTNLNINIMIKNLSQRDLWFGFSNKLNLYELYDILKEFNKLKKNEKIKQL